MEPAHLRVEPGRQVTARVQVRNIGRVVDRVTLSVHGEAAGWASLAPPTLNVYPGTEETTTVTFAPPRSPTARAGSVPIMVRADSSEDPGTSEIEEGTLTIEPFRELDATLQPVTSYGVREGHHTVRVANNGNAPAALSLEAMDADQLLAFVVEPESLRIAPGATAAADVVVRPASDIARRPGVRHAFTIRIADESGFSVAAVAGGFRVEGSRLSRRPRILLAAGVAVALLVGTAAAASQLLPSLVAPIGTLPPAAVPTLAPTTAPTLAPTPAPTAVPTGTPTRGTAAPPTAAPVMVVAPNLSQLTLVQAVAVLEEAGFVVGHVGANIDPVPPDWIVVAQDPPPGTQAPIGTPIDLSLADPGSL